MIRHVFFLSSVCENRTQSFFIPSSYFAVKLGTLEMYVKEMCGL
jgi:hypothetical protein